MNNTAQHTVAPEDIMALLDGELPAIEAKAVAIHIDACTECAAIAAQFRETSRSLAGWTVEPVPASLNEAIIECSAKTAAGDISCGASYTRPRLLDWRLWALAGGGAVAAIVLILATARSTSNNADRQIARSAENFAALRSLPDTNAASRRSIQAGIAGAEAVTMPAQMANKGVAGMMGIQAKNAALTAASADPAAPMIARTVSLTIVVKDVPASRTALDAILSRFHGYAAQLTINTPENDARSFSASLRIPASALPTALAEIRKLGRVQSESQSGEEVSQQHTDLVARLNNARETEQRLRGILQQRTGKVAEVLEVEEQISKIRGEIERMEAEQKALEHRVDFASVDLQLAEEYKAQLSPPSTSVGTRMHNALVDGIRNAGSSLLAIVLFFEEYGPVLVLWFAILATPIWLLWRRYRRAQNAI